MIFNETCGVVASPVDVRDYTIKAANEFPSEFSLKPPVIKNQGSEGTCVAHGVSSVIEYHFERQHNVKKQFSTEFIYGYRDVGYYIGDGMVVRDALKTVQKHGDPFVSDCRGNSNYKDAMENISANMDKYLELAYPHRISSYVRLKSDDEIKTALMNFGPVVISMKWYKDSKLVDDVYTWDSSKSYGGHCVVIYGWNEQGWLVQNSWGAIWGKDGRFILPYNFKMNEAWGIVDEIIDDTLVDIVTPKKGKFAQFCYLAWNWIANTAINVWNTIKGWFKKKED